MSPTAFIGFGHRVNKIKQKFRNILFYTIIAKHNSKSRESLFPSFEKINFFPRMEVQVQMERVMPTCHPYPSILLRQKQNFELWMVIIFLKNWKRMKWNKKCLNPSFSTVSIVVQVVVSCDGLQLDSRYGMERGGGGGGWMAEKAAWLW